MKYRYIQIFSFLVALLSFSIFSACEVDDKIVFVQDKVNPPSQSEEMSFSVSESKQVCFSKGNLQYHPANNEWRFAESQLDYIGDANINISATYNGWLDLFGWSTSATNFGVSTSTNDNDYSGDFVDWGTNQIGSDAPNTWRTLSNDEWDYLLNTRTNADALRGVAQVNGVNGLVLLPDTWECPSGVTFKSGFNTTYGDGYAAYQTFTAEQWSLLESAGAIFLPASGLRYGSDVRYVQNHGNYWSATENNSFRACDLFFVSDEAFMYESNRYEGFSVRLVKDLLPVVTTSTITQITETTAVAGGSVTSDGNASVTERGVVYSTNPNPVITNLYNTIKPCGSGTGSFTCDLTNLQPNTTYYVRAYATNSVGTAYGEEVSFTTEVVANPPYLTAMPFSISASKQIYFSSGNLQYHPANKEWRFAESQLDYIGYANSNCSSNYNGWIDLFGWSGSTGYANFGVSTSILTSDYSGSFVDWGTNKIGNDVPNTWRTLTYDEWGYILYNRYKAKSFYGIAQVNGVNGLVLLPDTWECPSGVTFKSGFNTTYGDDYAAYQTFTSEQWSKLESAGAVFLPASGSRYGSNVDGMQGNGYYWSATEESSGSVSHLYFYSGGAYMDGLAHFYGRSVRLVKDIEGGTTPDTPTESENTENGHEYVDLGLSVKWATCNVGATKPEEYGDYFAWGETQPTDYYDWSTYKYCNGSVITLTKYNTNSIYGTVDNKTTLELSDDAARANWGGSWRMPTKAEQDELRNNCTWTWTSQNGVNGYKVTSKSNGNSIFLPAAGYRSVRLLTNPTSFGYYWSSSLDTDSPKIAYELYFGSDYVYSSSNYRDYGRSVRPVCP